MSSVLENSHCNRQPHSGYEHIFLPRRRRRLQLFPHIGTGNRQHKQSRDGRDSVAHRPPCRGDQAAVEACGNGCQGGQGSHVVVHAFCQTHRRSRVSPCQGWKLFWRIMSLPVFWSPSVCLHWFTLLFLSPTNPHSPACPECLTRAWTRPCPLYLSPLTASSSRTLRLLPCSHRQATASVQPGRQGRLRSSSLSRGRTSYHPPAALTWHTQQPTHQLFSFAWEK